MHGKDPVGYFIFTPETPGGPIELARKSNYPWGIELGTKQLADAIVRHTANKRLKRTASFPRLNRYCGPPSCGGGCSGAKCKV